jgi:SAM-dependent methyltransferase
MEAEPKPTRLAFLAGCLAGAVGGGGLAFFVAKMPDAREPLAPVASVAGLASASSRAPQPTPAAVFTRTYATARWGKNAAGEGTSGSGSTMEATVAYRAFLQAFFKEHDVKSVVDAGCGDWESTHAIDWSGIDYKGYDVVASVIAKDQAKYSAPNIKFFTADILEEDLPPADVLIAKEVLQHLTNADVQKFLKQVPKYRFVLLTDGVDVETFSADNHDIPRGEYRTLDPTAPPFNLTGAKVLTWWDGFNMHQVVRHARL